MSAWGDADFSDQKKVYYDRILKIFRRFRNIVTVMLVLRFSHKVCVRNPQI